MLVCVGSEEYCVKCEELIEQWKQRFHAVSLYNWSWFSLSCDSMCVYIFSSTSMDTRTGGFSCI